MYHNKFLLLAATAMLAGMSVSPALAQSSADAQKTEAAPKSGASTSATLQEVIVTAERRETNLQTTPVAVTSLTALAIQDRGIHELQGVARAAPNVLIRTQTGNRDAANMNIRGQAGGDNLITSDTAVGVYLDDVYLARQYGLLSDMLDVAGVEIDKGPQGVLFGRNTNGGAIRITSQAASPSAGLTGYFRGSYGNFADVNVSGAINIPIIKDVLAIRYAILHHAHDGYTTAYFSPNGLGDPRAAPAILTPLKQDDLDATGQRLSLTFTPNAKLTVSLSGDTYMNDTHGQLYYNSFGDLLVGAESAANLVVSPQHAADFYSGLTNSIGFGHTRVDGARAEVVYDFNPNLTAKFIGGYRHLNVIERGNVNGTYGTAGPTGGGAITLDGSQNKNGDTEYTGEFQLLGKALDGRLSWLAGLYDFKENGFDRQNRDRSVNGLSPLPDDTAISSRASIGENRSKSAFVHGSYDFNDRLSVGGGVRWTQDDKTVTVSSTNRGPLGSNGTNPPPPTTAPGGVCLLPPTASATCQLVTPLSDSYLTWQANLDYKFTDDVFGYLKAGTGHRSGGGQARALNAATATPFGPEEVRSYEVGLKTEWLQRRLRINVAAFNDNVTNLQISSTATVSGQTTTFTANSGDAKRYGVEADGQAILGGGLSVEAAVGWYTESRTTATYVNPVTSTLTTYRFINRSPVNGTVSVVWQGATPLGGLKTRLDAVYVPQIYPISSVQISPVPASLVGSAADPHANVFKGYTLVNGRVTLNLNEKVSVGVWVQNLFDQKYYRAGFQVGALFPANTGDPRTYGVSVGYSF